jgi:hypothetical protein
MANQDISVKDIVVLEYDSNCRVLVLVLVLVRLVMKPIYM